MSLDPSGAPPAREGNNPAFRQSQNKPQLLEATMRSVPKLKELNYTQWKSIITNSIKKAKLWGYIDGSIEEPVEHDASNLTTYYDEIAAVRNAIMGSLESGAQRYVEEALDPREAWLALEQKYFTAETETDTQLVAIEKQLVDLRLDEGGDMIEHIAEFCRMRSHLSDTRLALDDQASISLLYRSLPSSYRQSVVTSDGTEMKDFGALCARLSYMSQNPEPQTSANEVSVEDYTSWGVPQDIKLFGLTGDKNPLLEERAAVTCRDCLLKDHKAGTPECPQYEWRMELWGGPRESENESTEEKGTLLHSESNKKFVYEFSEPVKVALSFSELKLKDHLLQSLNRCNLRSPYGLQQCVILPITNGRNVIAQAPPETGKTTAMILSVLQLTDTSKKGIQALIICSTDGEASQVQSMTTSLGYQCYKPSNSQSVRDDLGQLSEGHNFSILVGTPDRVLLLSRQGILSTLGVRILALDDLDTSTDNAVPQMLLDLYQYLPRSIQTLIIGSGLLNKPHEGLIPFINKPLYITLGRHNRVSGGITHAFIIVPSNQEPTFFNQLLNNGTTPVRGAVLCDTFSEVNNVRYQLENSNHGCYYTDASMSEQRHHERIESFRTSSANIHLATTISVPLRRILGAWGRDNINFWIINYNIPSSPQNYSERIQYLGLCSGKNTAITLVNEGTDEINMIREIETHFGIQMAELRWEGDTLR